MKEKIKFFFVKMVAYLVGFCSETIIFDILTLCHGPYMA